MAGVDDTGLTLKTIEEIVDEMGVDALTTISPALNLDPDQFIGQIFGIIAKKMAELWELEQVAYNAMNRNAAEGFLLDNIGDLTGTKRDPATKSQVSCTVNLGASFSQPAGVMTANVAGAPDLKFVNKNTVTSTTAGNYTAIFEATVTGPVIANAGTLTVITTPVSGWNSITNPTDATVGSNIESDAAYRVRQRNELAAAGSGTVDGMRADILRIPGVQQAFVFENTTNVTDGNGLPAHSIEVVIYDGSTPTASDATIFQTIWDNKPSGIETYGFTTGTATASDGTTRTVKFSRATVKPVYLNYVNVVTDPAFFSASEGPAQIKAAAALRGDTIFTLGVDVVALQLKGAALSVAGVVDVPTLYLGFSANPVTTANLVINQREIADIDTSRITVSFV